MAVLRDTLRLGVFEPFARWKLSRDLTLRKKQKSLRAVANGTANGQAKSGSNGNGHAANQGLHPSARELRQVHRSVLRFAEQGWSVVYYTLQWSLGLVCRSFLGSGLRWLILSSYSMFIVIYQRGYWIPRTFGGNTHTSLSRDRWNFIILLRLRFTYTRCWFSMLKLGARTTFKWWHITSLLSFSWLRAISPISPALVA